MPPTHPCWEHHQELETTSTTRVKASLPRTMVSQINDPWNWHSSHHPHAQTVTAEKVSTISLCQTQVISQGKMKLKAQVLKNGVINASFKTHWFSSHAPVIGSNPPPFFTLSVRTKTLELNDNESRILKMTIPSPQLQIFKVSLRKMRNALSRAGPYS